MSAVCDVKFAGTAALSTVSLKSLRKARAKQKGQGMTEYIIIVALIAVAAIAAFQFFGQTIRSQTSGIANEVAGKPATDAIKAAGDAATKTDGERSKKGLDAYNSANK